MHPHRLVSMPAALLLALFAGVSCAANPPATAPVPAAPAVSAPAADPVAPTPDLLRAAANAELTGLELGTMWTFENPPLDYWQRTYDFRPTQQWLDEVRLASVRYGDHCSASFVSPRGLVVTNHHCVRDCVAAVSPPDTDYVVRGFAAPARQQEVVCPDLYLDQLVEIQDVTDRMQSAARAAADEQAGARAQEAEQERLEKSCATDAQTACQVVSLFHGGQFKLYRYHRYSPVKLVFAPEVQAAFFGGDPDNFTYPRYDFDFSFVRAYEPDSTTPARTDHYFRFATQPIREGDVVFVTGNPGSTSRSITVSQAMFQLRFQHPFIVDLLESQRALLQQLASQSPEQERNLREEIFGVENSLKAYRGQLGGLQDSALLGRKVKWEQEFRAKVAADAALQGKYGDVWDRIASIQREKLRVAPVRSVLGPNFYGYASPHLQLSELLGAYLTETAKPESERSEEFRGEALTEAEEALRGSRLEPQIGVRLLAMQLALAQRYLPADDPFIRAALGTGETPAAAAARLIAASRVADPAFRESILQGGTAAYRTSADPLIALARIASQEFAAADARWNQLDAQEHAEQERLASALFAAYGTQLPPDATFTLRISDGVIASYPYNGTIAPAFTSVYGFYGRSREFNNQEPFNLPAKFAERRSAVHLDTQLDFVSTNDITGGNSGSPVIDRNRNVLGLAFDGNIESLPNEFLFRPDSPGRTVSVSTLAILEALQTVYGAKTLVDELTTAAR